MYFEDLEIGSMVKSRVEYLVSQEEIIEFAKKWDPQPHHVNEYEAEKSVFGSLTAAGCHIFTIRTWLIHQLDTEGIMRPLAALGYDAVRFPNPVRPGDRLSLTSECIDKQESKSKPDRGIVKFRMTVSNQAGEPVLVHVDTIMVPQRPTD